MKNISGAVPLQRFLDKIAQHIRSLVKIYFCKRGEREKVSQRGLGGFPHERLANPEGVKGKGF
ncbi:hypothetical protein BV372_15705 [Nostoc sp. T09]|nr:hypothetical protein BV372_15705 [Nostoc sp. T09]